MTEDFGVTLRRQLRPELEGEDEAATDLDGGVRQSPPHPRPSMNALLRAARSGENPKDHDHYDGDPAA